MNIEEIWIDIDGYVGYYQVSNMGRIRSLDRILYKSNDRTEHRKGQLMAQSLDKDGYCAIGLRTPEKVKKSFRVHQLVAKAFIPNPHNYDQINHKDENPLNNCVNNLEWCNSEYNNNYGNRNDKLRKYDKFEPILCYYKGKYLKEYENVNELCKVMNIPKNAINSLTKYSYYNDYTFAFKNRLKSIPEELNNNFKKRKCTNYVAVYNYCDGNLINIYNDIDDASLKMNISIHIIRHHIRDSTPFEFHYIFKYYKNKNDIKNKTNIDKQYKTIVIQYDEDMNEIAKWLSAKDASRKLNYDDSEIYKCLRGEKEKVYNFIWKKAVVSIEDYILLYNSYNKGIA